MPAHQRDANSAAAQRKSDEAGELIADVASQIGALSVEIADVVGHTQAVQSATDTQNGRLKTLGNATLEITEANRSIAEMARQTSETAGRARDDIGRSSESIEQAIREVGGLVKAVEESGGELTGLETAMARVSQVTNEIRGVTKQTNLLALNAAIEAARAGEAGRGFAVVAGEVKALARQTAEATSRIDATLETLTEQVRRLSERMQVSAQRAAQVGRTASTIGGAVSTVGRAMGPVCEHAAAIAQSTQGIARRCESFIDAVGSLNAESARSTAAIKGASENLDRILGGAEQIMMRTAASGYPTEDTPFIEQAQLVAARIEERMAQAVASNEITVDELFDGILDPIPGTNPQQYMTRYIPFLDRAICPLMDPVLEFDKRVVFCAPSDHNKLIPCHNPPFRHPNGPDPVWNAIHSRNRRIFPDKTAAAVIASTAPFLLQTYRRDMGYGVFVLMKDASAPIRVNGRLWGGLRVCYVASRE